MEMADTMLSIPPSVLLKPCSAVSHEKKNMIPRTSGITALLVQLRIVHLLSSFNTLRIAAIAILWSNSPGYSCFITIKMERKSVYPSMLT